MKEGLLHRQQLRQLAVDYVYCGAPGLRPYGFYCSKSICKIDFQRLLTADR